MIAEPGGSAVSGGVSSRMGYICLLLAAFFWGMYGPVSRWFLQLGLSSQEIAFLRCAVGCFCFGLHAVIRGQWRIAPRDLPKIVLFGMIGLGLLNISYQVAVRECGAAFAVILLYSAPAWVALISVRILRHPLSRRCIGSMVAAMIGVALVTLSGSTENRLTLFGTGAALAAGFFYALHFPWNYHWRNKYSPVTLYFYAMLGGALLLFPLAGYPADLAAKPVRVWLHVLPGLVLVTYLPYLCYGSGMRGVNPAPAAVIVNLEPVIGCAAAYLWWHERFSPSGWFGAALVISAVFLLVAGKQGEERRARDN